MTREEAIQKVDKILRFRDKAGTEEEAISNVLIAQRLMAKYDIDEDDLESGLDQYELAATEVIAKGRAFKWKMFLAGAITKNYRCKYSVDPKRHAFYFFGYKTDVEIAKRVYEYLDETGTALAKKEVQKAKAAGKVAAEIKDTYLIGFVNGIESALSEQCAALMLVVPEQVTEAFKQMVAGAPVRKTSISAVADRQIYLKGFDDGKAAIAKNCLEGGSENV